MESQNAGSRPPAPQILESPIEVLTTLGADGSRNWLYPTPSPGRFKNARGFVAWLLIVLYIALPIIPIGGKPAILLDFISREFAIFGLVFYPTDTLLLLVFMIGILLAVILFTALLGRVWCGWGCPQTVYLEFVFRPIERLLEGSENVRRRRDEGSMNLDKAWRKTAKLLLYLLISLVLAHTFVAYFVGWSQLVEWMTSPPADHWGFFVMMAMTTGLILYDFAYFREQMCTIACPYARMQSVLIDPDSLIVSYDPNRGEPRARRSKKKMQEEADGVIPAMGDCIDCGLCVRTCPTGIDIREGLQMECIACTQCIDACDSIMDKIDRPRGLIRYTSERALEGGTTRTLRTRTVLYSLLLLGIVSAFTLVIVGRGEFDVNVGRAVGAPYTELPDGRVANRLRFRVRNQTGAPSSFDIRLVAPAGLEVRPVGAVPVPLDQGEMKRLETWIIAPAEAFQNGVLNAEFSVVFGDDTEERVPYSLIGPSQ